VQALALAQALVQALAKEQEQVQALVLAKEREQVRERARVLAKEQERVRELALVQEPAGWSCRHLQSGHPTTC